MSRNTGTTAAIAALACALAALPPQPAHAAEPWAVAGQQGLVKFVIVPLAQASDAAAYAEQVKLLCEPERTCFLNFYTNSSGAQPAVPLPAAIEQEATAVYRLSMKRGAGRFQWSCRARQVADCF